MTTEEAQELAESAGKLVETIVKIVLRDKEDDDKNDSD